jgi:choline dehydrogenase-like flavoprotein
MATYVLANAGLKVCLIEAGPMYDPAKNSRAKLTEQTYQKDANIRIFP